MSISREEIALQITLKAIEHDLVLMLGSPDKGAGEINILTAHSIAEVYNNILSDIKAYER